MEPTVLPDGLSLRSRTVRGNGVVETYANATGDRELSLLNGVGGEWWGAWATLEDFATLVSLLTLLTGDTAGVYTPHGTRVRDFEAHEFFDPETDTRVAVWWAGDDPTERCQQYTVIGVGLTQSEWDAVLAGIQWGRPVAHSPDRWCGDGAGAEGAGHSRGGSKRLPPAELGPFMPAGEC